MIFANSRAEAAPAFFQRLAGRSLVAAAALLASCGGGNSNPFGNPESITNDPVLSGNNLSFAYFEKCVNPIFLADLQITLNGASTINTCAGAGCHAVATGTGGAFRIEPTAQPLDVKDPANTPDVIRASDIYKNFVSAEGETVIGVPIQSKLLQKPLVLVFNHGGGKIFASPSDANAQIIQYWITHPAPDGQDEFSTATYSMFTPPDPDTGTCNTQ
jgi:hypothetical protein